MPSNLLFLCEKEDFLRIDLCPLLLYYKAYTKLKKEVRMN